MQYLIKKLNKYNGNICFTAKDASEICYIFECDRNGYLYSATSSKNIKNICALDEKSWYVTFENSGWIGLFTKGILIENFISTSFSEISQLELASGFFFVPENSYNSAYKYTSNYLIALDRIDNTLTKFYLYNNDTQYSIYWTYTMPEPLYAENSHITVREDGYIIYSNNYNSYLISDMGNSAGISQSLSIGSGNGIFVSVIKNNQTSYVRIRSVDGNENSSSSSSSSIVINSTSSNSPISSLSSLSSLSSVEINSTSSNSSKSSISSNSSIEIYSTSSNSSNSSNSSIEINSTSSEPSNSSIEIHSTSSEPSNSSIEIYSTSSNSSLSSISSLSSDSSATSDSEDKIVTMITGATQDVSGKYYEDGTYNGTMSYRKLDNTSYIWKNANKWITQKKSPATHKLAISTSSITGGKYIYSILFPSYYGGAGGGYISASNDSGVNWTTLINSGDQNWSDITCSSTGATVYACVYKGNIWKSTDYGYTWTELTYLTPKYWNSIQCTAGSGGIIAGEEVGEDVAGYANVWVSADAGTTWNTVLSEYGTSAVYGWESVACTSDNNFTKGALSVTGDFWISNSTGWHSRRAGGYGRIAISGDGNVVAAAMNGGYIYISNNAGVDWYSPISFIGSPISDDLFTANGNAWLSISANTSGQIMLTTNGSYYYDATAYVSNNYGLTWTNQYLENGFVEYVDSKVAKRGSSTYLITGAYNGVTYTNRVCNIVSTAKGTVDNCFEANVLSSLNGFYLGTGVNTETCIVSSP